MKLAELQDRFFSAILDQGNDFETCISDQGGITKLERISIYQNAYFARLKETIETDHEILGLYLGDELFDQMVAAYVQSSPSQYRSLRFYSEGIPQFLQQTPPFSNYPVIAELARFERFLLYAFDAAEAPRATLADLQVIAPDDWPVLTFSLHPSSQLFLTGTNCVECWQALKVQQAPPEAVAGNAYWLIWRNQENLTEFLSLSNTELCFIQGILRGDNFSDLCDELSQFMDAEEVSQFAVAVLVTWLNKGIVSKIKAQS